MSLHGTKCDLGAAPTNVRSWESNGLNADVAFGPFMTPKQMMILPTWSGYTDDNTQNLWKRGSDLRKRSPHTGVVCSRTALEKYHEEAYRHSHDRHADCRADLRPVRKCGTRVAVELLVRW